MSKFAKEQTLVVIKPDGVQRGLIGEIIKRFERVGLKLVAAKFFVPTPDFIEQHYNLDPEWKVNVGKKSIEANEKKGITPPTTNPEEAGQKVIEGLKAYMTTGPVFAMVWQGAHAAGLVRKLVGGTEPLTSDVGTIRGDFVLDSYQMADTDGRAVRNLIHASGNTEEAENEIKLWFDENEIVNYRLINEAMLYDVNLDGITE